MKGMLHQIENMRDGVLSDRVVGTKRELVIVSFTEAHQTAAEALDPDAIDIVELNLEDAFIEYTRGRQRPLPVFHNEPASTISSNVTTVG